MAVIVIGGRFSLGVSGIQGNQHVYQGLEVIRMEEHLCLECSNEQSALS